MMMILLSVLAAGSAVACPIEQIVRIPGENHVMFRGVAPEGRRIAIGWDRVRGDTTERGAYIYDLKTKRKDDAPGLNNAASFSPDGSKVIAANYSGKALKTELAELEISTGKVTTIASSPAYEWLASYSPDGHRILFNSTREGQSDLYVYDKRSGALSRITSDSRYEAHGQFFDKGRKVLFHRQVAGDDYDIILKDLESGKERSLGSTPGEEAYPAMSQDGRWIAFSTTDDHQNPPHLAIMRADGTQTRALTDAGVKDAYSSWSPDGRWLYFVRFHDDGAGIYRMAMKNGHCTTPRRSGEARFAVLGA